MESVLASVNERVQEGVAQARGEWGGGRVQEGVAQARGRGEKKAGKVWRRALCS